MFRGEPDIAFGDQGVATAALMAMSGELFPSSNLFLEKLAEENNKRPPSRPLVTREQYNVFMERMEIFSITGLFTLSVPEPEGFMNAVFAATPPCECFGSIPAISRKVFVQIIRDFQIALGSLPPGGVGMVGTGPSSSSDSVGKVTPQFSAHDLDGVLRTSLSDKASAAKSFSCLRAIWRMSDKEKISKYQSGSFMTYNPSAMMCLWRTNLMQSLGGSVLPTCWRSARVFSQVSTMAVFTDLTKLDLFLQMKVSGQDMSSLSFLDFYPGGVLSWKITDAVSVTPGAKVILRECVEGLVTVLSAIHSEVWELARASLISGLSAFSYNAMSSPDAFVLFNYHSAFVAFASIITTEEGTAARQLSGPEHTVKVLIDCFAHLAKDKWVPSNRNFTEFNNDVYPAVIWPGSKSAADSPGKRKDGSAGEPGKTPKKPRNAGKGETTYEERHAMFEVRQARRDAATKAAGTASTLSLSSLSLGGGGSARGGAGSFVGIKTQEKRLCVATLCNLAGVKYKNQVVKCTRAGGCGYTHPGNVDEVLKGDAANAIGRLKSTTSDAAAIAYMTEAEVFYAARAT